MFTDNNISLKQARTIPFVYINLLNKFINSEGMHNCNFTFSQFFSIEPNVIIDFASYLVENILLTYDSINWFEVPAMSSACDDNTLRWIMYHTLIRLFSTKFETKSIITLESMGKKLANCEITIGNSIIYLAD